MALLAEKIHLGCRVGRFGAFAAFARVSIAFGDFFGELLEHG